MYEQYSKDEITFVADDTGLTAHDFIDLANAVWPGEYDEELTCQALGRTINITARRSGFLVGCVRILTDGYYFGTIPEILVRPDYQKRGIGRRLMDLAWEISPTMLFFGAQPGNEIFFEKLGFSRSIQSFSRKKARR